MSFRATVVVAFALIAGFTVAVITAIIMFVFNSYFSVYSSENMESTAQYAASRIASEVEGGQSLALIDYAALAGSMMLPEDVGLMVIDSDGLVRYATEGFDAGVASSDPSAATKVAIFEIVADGSEVGSVRIWAYGSEALMSRSDIEFRDDVVEALIIAAMLALLVSIAIGVWFSNWIARPISKITVAANRISGGDLSARCGLMGNNEIGRLGMQFDEMAQSVESDRLLELRMTSDVAHELRTPLMAVQSTVEAMIDGVYETNEKNLTIIDGEVQRLSRLVDAILRLSRIEGRKQPFDCEATDIGELVESLVASHEAFVQDSGLQIEAHVEGTVRAMCDRDMIAQAVANLISNAVRYTPEGRIDVRVFSFATLEGGMAAIEVKDTGIGLTEEEAKMVFARFWRGNSGGRDNGAGLGIGLTVVKEIVNRHHGRISVSGKPGEGASFTICIPACDEGSQRKGLREPTKHLDKLQRGVRRPDDGSSSTETSNMQGMTCQIADNQR